MLKMHDYKLRILLLFFFFQYITEDVDDDNSYFNGSSHDLKLVCIY